MGVVEKANKSSLFIFTVSVFGIISGILAIWDIVIKPMVSNQSGMTLSQYYSQVNWTPIIGQLMLLGCFFAVLIRSGKVENKLNELRRDTGNSLKNHQDYFDHFQKDYFIGLYSLEYKVSYPKPYTKEAEMKYVISHLHAIADKATGIELKEAISKYYQIPVYDIDNIIAAGM
jgi:hypothetical protein